MKYKIIAIDDDTEVLSLLNKVIPQKRFTVLTTNRGEDGLEMIYRIQPDLIILDLMLPDISGLEICRIVKRNEQTNSIPIIMLTARTRTDEKISGLQMGADDYVVKPFSPKELVARIDAVLRRVLYKGEPEEIVRNGELEINISKHTVRVKNKNIKLTAKEFDLLCLLARKAGRVLQESYLLDSVWGYSVEVTTKTLDVHIYKIRKKLGKKISDKIQTIRGIGYKFIDQEEE